MKYRDHRFDFIYRDLCDYRPCLFDVDLILNRALHKAGYYERSYYSVPNGYALITRLEQINLDGSPKSGGQRWNIDHRKSLNEFSLSTYFKLLFKADPGYFRLIVFVITTDAFVESEDRIYRDSTIELLRFGGNKLPQQIGFQLLSSHHDVTALIYEFESSEGVPNAKVIVPGRLSANIHIEQSGIGRNLL